MSAYTGYMLVADISGYTAFLTQSETEHAAPIIRSLLTSLVEQIGEPLKLWGMEGDAVLAYTTDEQFPSGETFLSICENFYNSFAQRRQNIIANTTCACRACSNVGDLDLKIMAHYGPFEEIQVGPMTSISGAEVVLVHRMAKTDVKKVTGIHSYALFSDAAAKAMDIDAALVPFSQDIEHFGEVGMKVYDLAKAWQRFRAMGERHFLSEEDGIWTYRRPFTHPQAVIWEALTAPDLKAAWMDSMISVDVELQDGRIANGAGYHCVHEAAEFRYWVTDWEPFDYFSTRINDPAREGIHNRETYQVIATKEGSELRYTLGPSRDEADNRHEEAEEGTVAFLADFWPKSFDKLDAMLAKPDAGAAG